VGALDGNKGRHYKENMSGEIGRRLLMLLRRRKIDADLNEEMRLHRELREQQGIERGFSPKEAHYAAQRRFGNDLALREESRDMWGWSWLEHLVQDLRYGLRMAWKNPAFAAVAILTLALGIGANTAIFSLINAALLKMLPVAHPERLVTIGCSADDVFPYPAYKQLRDRNQVFSGVLAFRRFENFDLEMDGHAGLAKGQVVSGNYYSVLGVNAILGRTIAPDDDRVEGGGPVAVISYDYWAKRFNRDANAVGRKIEINGSPFTLIGVTPPDFFGLVPGSPIDVTIPICMVAQVRPEWAVAGTPYSVLSAPFRNWLYLMARLGPGVAEQQALANADPIYRHSMREAADGMGGLPFNSPRVREMYLQFRLRLEPGGRGLATLRPQFSRPLLILMAVVGLLLFICCANVANLMLARASVRQREIAVRIALGAGRRRLVRQLITESALLALAGGAAGLLLAVWATSSLVALMSHASSPISLSAHPDARVLAFTALVSFFTAILFGLVPAMRTTEPTVSGLKESGRILGGTRPQSRLGKALVVSQVALSLVLLVGAGLLVRSLRNLRDFYPGFNAQHVLLVSMNPSLVRYKEEQVVRLYQRLMAEIKAFPGVRSASFSDFSPLAQRLSFTMPTVEGYTPRPGETTPVMLNIIGPEYFKALETPVLLGREFTQADAAGAVKVGIINQAMARHFFGDANPIGRRFSIPGYRADSSWLEIVGVIQDAKYQNLRDQAPPQAYIPFLQSPESGYVTIEVRASTEPSNLAAGVRRIIQRADSRLPVFDVKTLTEQVDESLVEDRLVASFSSLFGVLALLLAAVGLYGVMAHAVSRRSNEIGVRMALGAQPRQILEMVLRETLWLVSLGVAIGIPIAMGASRLIRSELYGLRATDPLTILMMTALMLFVAGLAGYLPARRATKVDPMAALRYE
jgi:predicted permease